MDALIKQLEEITANVLNHIDEITYEDIAAFVDKRQDIVEEITQQIETVPLSSEQKLILSDLLKSDNLIREKMFSIKNEASDWLSQRGQAKLKRNAYETVYAPDSIIMDHRK